MAEKPVLEPLTSNPSVHAELVATGCGLHANSKNPEFHPGAEAVAKWAALMYQGADEIKRLNRLVSEHCVAAFQMGAEFATQAKEIDRLTRERDEAIKYRDDEFQLRDALVNENQRLRAALEKIACWHVAFPESNYPGYASMALVTAREAVPRAADETKADLKRRQAEWDCMYAGDKGMGELSLQGFKIPPRPTE